MAREKGAGSLQLEKSGRWTVRFCVNGKRISRSAGTRDRQLAEKFLMRILAPLGRGEKSLPLAEAWHSYLISPNRRELAPSTLDNKRFVWMKFADWIERWHPEVTQLAHVSAEMVGEYLAELRSGHTASTYNGRICVLREIFRTLAERAGLVEDVWANVRLHVDDSHSRRSLSVDELRRLLSAAQAECGSGGSQINGGSLTSDWYLLLSLGIYTGMRLGDCCLLSWRNVDLRRGILQVIPRKTKRHSKGVPVTIPIHPMLRVLLDDRITRRNGETDAAEDFVMPVIAEMYGTARWRVCERIARIFKSAGIGMQVKIEGRVRLATEASFHSLRHTFVSLAANAGVPLSVIASIVGHTSTAMTRHYYHENEAVLRSAVDAIPFF